MPTINIETTCAFSGHRILPRNFNSKEVELVVKNLIDCGYDTFLVGMAIGFDMLCFSIVEKFRKTNDIRLIACVPCKNQDANFNFENKKRYHKMLDSADEVIVLSEYYYSGCMQKRNRFMVDNSSILIAYLTASSGGTYSTVKYAISQDKEVRYMGK